MKKLIVVFLYGFAIGILFTLVVIRVAGAECNVPLTSIHGLEFEVETDILSFYVRIQNEFTQCPEQPVELYLRRDNADAYLGTVYVYANTPMLYTDTAIWFVFTDWQPGDVIRIKGKVAGSDDPFAVSAPLTMPSSVDMRGDLNGDCVVDGLDFIIFRDTWGNTCIGN